MFLASVCYGGSNTATPLLPVQDPAVQRDFNQTMNAIQYPNITTGTAQNFTIINATMSHAAVGNLVAGQCVQADAGKRLISAGAACSAGGGGSSALQVTASGVQITSPTASLNFFDKDFNLIAIGSTAAVTLNPATTDFIHNKTTLQSATFNVASGTVSGNLNVTNNGGAPPAFSVTENGEGGGVLQDDNGGALNFKCLALGDCVVIVSSYSDAQVGSADLLILDRNINRNDPIIRVFKNANNSAPEMRWDSPAPNMELVSISTDGAHGLGKWEPFAEAFQGVDLQVNNRAWSNGTFETLASWHPLSKLDIMPGLYFRSQNVSDDGGVLTSSDTVGVHFFSLNAHTVGLTGPANPANSYIFGLPDTVGSTGNILYHAGNRGGNFNVRQWKWTGSDFTYTPAAGVTISTVTVSSASINNLTISNGGAELLTLGSGLGYGVTSPSYNLDFECSNNGGSALYCAYITYPTGTALKLAGDSNTPTFEAVNTFTGTPTSAGQWAPAIYASNVSEGTSGGVAGNFQTAGSTGVYITATTGTGMVINSSTGKAVELRGGGLTAASYIQLASFTKATLAATTPAAVGQEYYCNDCATVPVCISTGTALGAFALFTSKTTACN